MGRAMHTSISPTNALHSFRSFDRTNNGWMDVCQQFRAVPCMTLSIDHNMPKQCTHLWSRAKKKRASMDGAYACYQADAASSIARPASAPTVHVVLAGVRLD